MSSNDHVWRALTVAIAGVHKIVIVCPSTVNSGRFIMAARDWCSLKITPSCPCWKSSFAARRKTTLPRLQIDICVEAVTPTPEAIIDQIEYPYEVPQEIAWARNVYKNRNYQQESLSLNEHCYNLLRSTILQTGWGEREALSVVYVARTIATLAGSSHIEAVHLAEAIHYKPRCK